MPAYLRLVAGLVSLFLFVGCGDSREDPTAAVPRSPTPEVEATEEEKVLTLLYWQRLLCPARTCRAASRTGMLARSHWSPWPSTTRKATSCRRWPQRSQRRRTAALLRT